MSRANAGFGFFFFFFTTTIPAGLHSTASSFSLPVDAPPTPGPPDPPAPPLAMTLSNRRVFSATSAASFCFANSLVSYVFRFIMFSSVPVFFGHSDWW